jgi:hypothetical protein
MGVDTGDGGQSDNQAQGVSPRSSTCPLPGQQTSRLRKDYFGTAELRGSVRVPATSSAERHNWRTPPQNSRARLAGRGERVRRILGGRKIFSTSC